MGRTRRIISALRPMLFFLVLASLGGGCATLSPLPEGAYLEGSIDPLRERWNGRVGRYSYDDALVDMGSPTALTQGSNVVVASWRQESVRNISIPLAPPPTPQRYGAQAYGPSLYEPLRGGSITKQVVHGSELRLVFRKSDGVLADWRYEEW